MVIFKQQTDIIEDQSHRSVMPYLLMESSNKGNDKVFKIDVVNHGVGPAIIEERTILYKGNSYNMEFQDFLSEVLNVPDSLKILNYSTLQPGFALPAGSGRNLITAGGDDFSYNEFLNIMGMVTSDSFQYRIKYRSIYNDHWEISSETNTPELIED